MQARLLIAGFLGAFCLVSTPGRTETTDPGKAFREPWILEVRGKATLTDLTGKARPVKVREKLRERALIETSKEGWVLVGLTADEKVLVGPESRLFIPVIAWEDGAVDRLELESGEIRLINLTSKGRQVVTPLSRDVYSESDLWFSYDAKAKRLAFAVFEGSATFRPLENENALTLGRGEAGSFQADLEKGEPVFDQLLHGRRAARGTLSEKGPMDTALRERWNQALDRAEKSRQTRAEKSVKDVVRSGAICLKPAGLLNECAWICEGNPKGEKKRCRVENPGVRCIRYRCDANGKWADPQELLPGRAPCGVRPLVEACDY